MSSAAWAADGEVPGVGARLWTFMGKLHPLTVHFPIALLMVGAAAEFLRRRRVDGVVDRKPGAASLTCCVVGAVAAAISVAMGLSLGETFTSSIVDWHKAFGISCAVIAAVAAVLGLAANAKPGRRRLAWYRFCLVLAGVLVATTGHYGGMATYGEDYIPRAFRELVHGPAVLKAPAPKAEAPGVSANKPVSTTGDVEFGRDVFPILSRHCFSCHAGGEGLAVKSEFEINSREGLLRGGSSGEPGIVAGQGAKSWIVRLAKGEDPDRIMPPRGDRLTSEQISVLERWIDRGAPWPGQDGGVKANEPVPGPKSSEGSASADGKKHWHWAFSGPQSAAKGIDEIIAAKLEERGIAMAPEADRATLLRRVSLDLIGLPPTPEEVDAFAADTSDGAYEACVDRLLASEHYGERWAAVWLDLARYADSHGYEKDGLRVMWPYRDWVIDAYNADMPFDRFTIEQLAGDMIEKPTTASRVATGFHRNTQINEEGGTDPEEFRVENIIDRTNTTASVWLGMTLACAQCHDHKYDPLPQKDYYRFYAFFDQDSVDYQVLSSTEKVAAGAKVPVPRRGNEAAFAEIEQRLKGTRELLAAGEKSLRDKGAEKAAESLRAMTGEGAWTPIKPIAAKVDGAAFEINDAGVITLKGNAPDKATYTLELPEGSLAGATGLLIEALLGENGVVGRSGGGNFVVSEVTLDVGGSPVPFDAASSDFWQGVGNPRNDEWRASDAIDGNVGTGWAVMPKTKDAHKLVLRLARPVSQGAGQGAGAGTLKIVQNYGGGHVLSALRVSVIKADVPMLVPEHVKAALATKEPSPEQREAILAFAASIDPSIAATRLDERRLAREFASLTAAEAMVLQRTPTPRTTHILQRGSWMSPGDEVTPMVPAVLAAASGQAASPDRLGLAKWLVDPANPLTARVQVNRLWARLWGHGLVETEEDFGTQGDQPTDRELLDYLATRYVKLGWSQKKLLREIVTSRAYRSSSAATAQAMDADPRNTMFARGARFRLDGEFIRDSSLAASGLLTRTLGGPSVFPPQPQGIWTQIYSGAQWADAKGPDRFRRGVYTFWRRTSHYPTFATFDAPSRELACTRRIRTNTPLQALTTLNDPQFVEAALALAQRAMGAAPDDAGRIGWMMRQALGRKPTEAEIKRLVVLAEAARGEYGADAKAAAAFAGQCPVPHEGVPDAELAAAGVVANVILNLDEFLTRE